MELPTSDSLQIIEERKNYLINKCGQSGANSYGLREIKTLERVINLIKLYQGAFNDSIKKEIAAIEVNEGETAAASDSYDILYSYEQEITQNSKLDISFIQLKNNGEKYIVLALKTYKKKLMKWTYQGSIQLSPVILDGILQKSTELGMERVTSG